MVELEPVPTGVSVVVSSVVVGANFTSSVVEVADPSSELGAVVSSFEVEVVVISSTVELVVSVLDVVVSSLLVLVVSVVVVVESPPSPSPGVMTTGGLAVSVSFEGNNMPESEDSKSSNPLLPVGVPSWGLLVVSLSRLTKFTASFAPGDSGAASATATASAIT